MGVDPDMIGFTLRRIVGVVVAVIILAFAVGAGLVGFIWYLAS